MKSAFILRIKIHGLLKKDLFMVPFEELYSLVVLSQHSFGISMKTTNGGLFMSSLCVIDIFGEHQVAVSSWAACTLIFFGKCQVAALHEQLVQKMASGSSS